MEKGNHHELSGEFEDFYTHTLKYEGPEFQEHAGEKAISKKQIAAIGAVALAAAAALAGLFTMTSKMQSDQKTTAPAAPSAVAPQ